MTTLAVIQARMGSTRLPGKVLADVGGRPLLAMMLRRLRCLPVDNLIVATSISTADDPIVAFCEAAGVQSVRGAEGDVLDRFAQALEPNMVDTVVRLTADCPLADPTVIADAIELHQRSGADYTSNTLVRTYPDGLDVEVIRADIIRSANAEASDPIEREHVTPFVYRRPERFRLEALTNGLQCGRERWTVDTAADLEFVREVARRVPNWPTAGWREILAVVGSRFRPKRGELVLRPAAPDDNQLLLGWRRDPVTVANSRSGTVVTAADHGEWFARRLDSPGGRLWIACVDDLAVGQVRVDVRCGVGEVSFSVDPGWRARGYGTEILRRLGSTLREDHQVRYLRAIVHHTNTPSLRAFLATAFTVVARDGEFVVLGRLL